MPKEGLIDLDRIKAISGNNPNFMQEVLETFLTNTPRDMKMLQAAANENDLDQTLYFAHKLKSSCSAMGFDTGTAGFQKIEDSIEKPDEKNELKKHIESVASLCAQAEIEIKIELSKYI